MTIATVLAAGLLPVIPQPTQWMPAEGECDLATASVSVAVCADSALGEEGYTMKIAPGSVKIVAGGETGRVWAWQTIAQLKAAGGKAPCGDIRDVPKYRLRGFVIDVARMFHSMDFLRDLVRTMSYYKMNLLHVHLNDNEIAPKNKPDVDWSKMYAAFRMECETYPGLTAKDGHYTKKEFREFMKLAGGKFALWNDRLGKKKNGERYTESDNWDRIYPALQTLSQKMWTGMRTDQTWEQFAALADAKREPKGVKSRHKTTLSNQ